MNEYINRDELKEALLRRAFYPVFVKTALESLPAIDIVRCKDCIHARNMPLGLCYLHTEPYDNAKGYNGDAVCVEPDDFCSYGERRDSDGEIH